MRIVCFSVFQGPSHSELELGLEEMRNNKGEGHRRQPGCGGRNNRRWKGDITGGQVRDGQAVEYVTKHHGHNRCES